MADSSSPDYKALFLQEEKRRRAAEQAQVQEETRRREAEEARQRADQAREKAEQAREQAEERNRPTTLDEYICACHDPLSVPLKVEHRSRSTRGDIPTSSGKHCPSVLRQWVDFPIQQATVYDTVRGYLQPEAAPRLFLPMIALEDFGRSICEKPISSEKDLEGVERYGLQFDNHSNALDGEVAELPERTTSTREMQPDQFCFHRLDGDTSTLLMTVEYKPPHKLSVETLCAGPRDMEFWEEVVNSETIPTNEAAKLLCNATRLTGAALVQEYHFMIQEGLAYSCVSTGITLVFLHVPEEDPTTLYYFLCVPNKAVQLEDETCFRQPLTAVARLLCLYLMSCRTSPRSNAWRNAATRRVHLWNTDFEHARSQIPNEELQKSPPNSEYVPSSPLDTPVSGSNRRATRSHVRCRQSPEVNHHDDSDDPDADPSPTAPGRKRDHSQIASSSPLPATVRSNPADKDGRARHHRQQPASPFCTQKCLMGLQHGGSLDLLCPNVSEHRKEQHTDKHQINAPRLVQLLEEQLNLNLNQHCQPFGSCGAFGAPFKIRCSSYGYTVVGKGTTSQLWQTVSRETIFYQMLRSVQGSAVPVFLGSIDLEQTYFLHGAGQIRHMLLMAWGGVPLDWKQYRNMMSGAISRSYVEVCSLGVRHKDLRPDNLLWNAELQRILLIDFHSSELMTKQVKRLSKRKHKDKSDMSSKQPRLMKA